MALYVAQLCFFLFQSQSESSAMSPATTTTTTTTINVDQAGIISMSPELQKEAGDYLASLRIKERPNNGVRLLVKQYFDLYCLFATKDRRNKHSHV